MKKKILIVDDSSLARRLTRGILESLGHEVEEASDGVQALEKYVLGTYDLVVLDMLMQGMYGLDVLQKIKALNPSQLVIVVTADIQRTTRDQVKEAGASAMVNKPVDKAEFSEVLEIILNGGTTWN